MQDCYKYETTLIEVRFRNRMPMSKNTMKRQSAISAFFKPASKIVREGGDEDDSSVNRHDQQQASTSSNAAVSESEIVAAHPSTNFVVEDDNSSADLPVPFDSCTLPNEMPSREGRTLRREWFTEIAWLRYNNDGTCHCAYCLWAIENNRLSRKNTEGIRKSRWAKTSSGWQDYRKGRGALHTHGRSSWHQDANGILQVRIENFLY